MSWRKLAKKYYQNVRTQKTETKWDLHVRIHCTPIYVRGCYFEFPLCRERLTRSNFINKPLRFTSNPLHEKSRTFTLLVFVWEKKAYKNDLLNIASLKFCENKNKTTAQSTSCHQAYIFLVKQKVGGTFFL